MTSENNSAMAAPGQLISAVCYAALIWVVYYGRHHYVYDGFSPIVPYIIMAVFAIMSVIRIVGFFRSLKSRRGASK